MEQLHTPEALAALLGVPKATVYQWNSKGTGPAPTRVGRHVRYRQVDVDAWLDEQRAGYRPSTFTAGLVVPGRPAQPPRRLSQLHPGRPVDGAGPAAV